MRPDDMPVDAEPTYPADLPVDAELRPLDGELEASGVRARRMLHGRTQPTNYFAMDLRARLLGAYSAEAGAESAAVDVIVPGSHSPGSTPRVEGHAGERSMPGLEGPRVARQASWTFLSARWPFLTAALVAGMLLAGVLVAATLGAGAIPR